MAWISEIAFRGGDGVAGGEFVEVTLAPGDDPSDFVVSLYRTNGNLHSGAGIDEGQVTLSSLTGLSHPDNPAYTIYTIPAGLRNSVSDSNEASGVALTDTSTGGGVVNFYSADSRPAITAGAGAADGAVSDTTLDHLLTEPGESLQFEQDGTTTVGDSDAGDSVLCLGAEARVRVEAGHVPAGELQVGDKVWTMDHGLQPLRWIGQSILDPDKHGAPIRMSRAARPGMLHNASLILSPQHRVLLRSPICERMYGNAEVLVAARKLVGARGFKPVTGSKPHSVVSLLFDHHEIIDAEGVLCESLYLGPQAQKVLALSGQPHRMLPARPIAERKRLSTLLERHHRNGKPLFAEPSPLYA